MKNNKCIHMDEDGAGTYCKLKKMNNSPDNFHKFYRTDCHGIIDSPKCIFPEQAKIKKRGVKPMKHNYKFNIYSGIKDGLVKIQSKKKNFIDWTAKGFEVFGHDEVEFNRRTATKMPAISVFINLDLYSVFINDLYTVIIDDDVYTMCKTPRQPNGVNEYFGLRQEIYTNGMPRNNDHRMTHQQVLEHGELCDAINERCGAEIPY